MIPPRLLLPNCRLFNRGNHRFVLKCYATGTQSTATNTSPKEKQNSIADDIIPKTEIDPVSGLPFRKLELIPIRKTDDAMIDELARPYGRVTPPPRADRMSTDQDWPSAWPTAHSFKASAVPLPIRMGFQEKLSKKPPPSKVANLELMKIPNFLHLTPPAIQRHCEAIKKFCTPWPEELTDDEKGEKLRRHHFPIEIITCDYVHSGPSIRDARSRIVTLQVKLADLPLGDEDARARQKFIRLAGHRYDKKTDTLTIVTDRCPVRHQNRDYALYLLTALFHEAWKEESWEGEITPEDQHKWFWNLSKSQDVVVDNVKRMKAAYDLASAKESATASDALKESKNLQSIYPEYIRHAKKELTKEEIVNMEPVKEFVKAWEKLRNREETVDNINAYGDSVRALFGLPMLPKD